MYVDTYTYIYSHNTYFRVFVYFELIIVRSIIPCVYMNMWCYILGLSTNSELYADVGMRVEEVKLWVVVHTL